jgi:putative membrane protein
MFPADRPPLTPAERADIRDAIAAAERKTIGEIFVVVAAASDDYRFIPLVWSTLIALLVPLPLIFLTLWPALTICLIQLLVFIALTLVLSIPTVRIAVVPSSMKQNRAHGLAVEQFLAHGLHTTEARTGVLVFISLAERHAEIVADAGIAAKVSQDVWDEIVGRLIADIRAGQLGAGLIATVGRAGDILAAHFPPRPRDRNELPNDIVLL